MKTTVEDCVARIEPSNRACAVEAQNKIAQLTMPHWAMGRLLDLAVELAAMTRTLSPQVKNKTVFIMAGDHGVAAEGVSLFPKEVTLQMVRNFVQGGAAINVLCRQMRARTIIVDAGVDGDLSDLAAAGQVVNGKVRRGTRNFALEPALTREEARQSVELGIALANHYAQETDVFATGEMGIANTTASAAIAAALLQCPVEVVVGRGTGVEDSRLAHKNKIIENALARHRPVASDALDVLAKVGGCEIGALTGLILGAASLRKPVLIDGFIATAAALLAHRLCPSSVDYMIASHASMERGHGLMWQALGKKPLLDLDLRLGEGTGAALAMPLIDAAVGLMTEMATFQGAQVSTRNAE